MHLDQTINVFAACCCAYGQGYILWIVQYLQQWWFVVEYKYSVVSGFGCAEIVWGEMNKEGLVGS
jgi:hypothetical protein